MYLDELPTRTRVYKAMNSVSRHWLVLFCSFLIATGLSGEEEKDYRAIPSTISRVHLFDGQALLLRTTTLELPAGRVRLAFEDLPEKLLDQTARLRLKGSSDLRLLDLRVETVVEKEFRTQEAEAAEKELKAAEQELREVTALYLAQVEQRKALSSIELEPSGEDKPLISVDRWKHIFGFVDSSLTRINARINELLGRIDNARRRLEIALTVAERYKSQKETRRKTVVVDLEAPRAGSYDLALEYGVEDAGWFPHYRLTLEESRSSSPSVKLTTAVYVYNESGENWNNAKLTLSTAGPNEPQQASRTQTLDHRLCNSSGVHTHCPKRSRSGKRCCSSCRRRGSGWLFGPREKRCAQSGANHILQASPQESCGTAATNGTIRKRCSRLL